MPRRLGTLSLTALSDIDEIESGDDLAAIVATSCSACDIELTDGDVLVLSQKVVSKAEGRRVNLADVAVTREAERLAHASDKDPRLVQLILNESQAVLRVRTGLVIVRHRNGMVLANAGIDLSNVGNGENESALLLPENPDASASKIRQSLMAQNGSRLAVLIIDSVGRPFREGVVGLCIGAAGLSPLVDLVGHRDRDGRPLAVTQVAIGDQIASAASLLMGEADEGRPVVLVRGVDYQSSTEGAGVLVRTVDKDLFK